MNTEEEAKNLWCFCANTRFVGAGMLQSDRCIASACAAWRWAPEKERRQIEPLYRAAEQVSQPPRPDYVPANYEWVAADPQKMVRAHWLEPERARIGFCGLAGKP